VVRPNFAGLNSLAKVLSEARPVYLECHNVLNNLPSALDVSYAADLDRSIHTAPKAAVTVLI
jgi:hypothetical protein